MNDDSIKAMISKFLIAKSFSVTEMGVGMDEIPDLRATISGESFLIEIKTKGDDPQEIRREQELLAAGKVVNRSESLGRRNRLSAIVKKGVVQLANRLLPNEFAVIWIHLNGKNLDLMEKRTFATLYGTQTIVDMGQGHPSATSCYYFENSDFFNHRAILSGVFVHFADKLCLCVNDLHPNADLFRKSTLYRIMGEAVCDPLLMERTGRAFIVDANIDRSRPAEVLQYIRTKYRNNRLLNIQFAEYSATVSLPAE